MVTAARGEPKAALHDRTGRTRWWESPNIKHRVAGVFQGGGARGLAYVGALKAFRRHGCWFEAVAGSSAGAIVAVLVAAGATPNQMEKLVPLATAAIRPVGRKGWLARPGELDRIGHYRTDELRKLLEVELRKAISAPTDRTENVTFEELFVATGIELNIVVLAAPDTPIVLSRHSAPNCQVSYAAVASSAIPVVMTPQLLKSEFPKRTFSITVDGGAWANYPTFVFKDPSVRAFYGAPALSSKTPVVGFILKDVDPPAPTKSRGTAVAAQRARGIGSVVLVLFAAVGIFGPLGWGASQYLDQETEADPLAVFGAIGVAAVALVVTILCRRALSPGLKVVGSVVGGFYSVPPVRLVTSISMAALSVVFISILSAWVWMFRGGMFFLFLGGFLYLLATAGAAVASIRYGQAVLDTGLPAMRAAMKATTGVPEWAGAAVEDLVVLVPVYCGIDTTSFSIPEMTRKEAISLARRDVSKSLEPIITCIETGDRPVSSPAQRDLRFVDPRVDHERDVESLHKRQEHTPFSWRMGSRELSTVLLDLGLLAVLCWVLALNNRPPSIAALLSTPRSLDATVGNWVVGGALVIFGLLGFVTGRFWLSFTPLRRAEKRDAPWALLNALFSLLWLFLVTAAIAPLVEAQPMGPRLLGVSFSNLSTLASGFAGTRSVFSDCCTTLPNALFESLTLATLSLLAVRGIGWLRQRRS